MLRLLLSAGPVALVVLVVCSFSACGDECPAGNLTCACTAENACNEDLLCVAGKCLDCEIGTAGCACGSQGCQGQLTCSDEGVCEAAGCPEGTLGCACLPDTGADGACEGELVCSAGGVCTAPVEPGRRPENPKCYSPCRTGFVDEDGEYRACDADGLMEGCLAGLECVDGSCVPPGNTRALEAATGYPACASDVDCPEHQACLEGACYSNCDSDLDCTEERKCHLRVCRVRCSSTDRSACTSEEYCALGADSTNGVCMPKQAPDGEQPIGPQGHFSIYPASLSFGDAAQSGAFELTNETDVEQVFTVAKLRHTEFTDLGPVLVRESPLQWLELGTDAGTAIVDSIEVTVPPRQSVSVRLAGARNPLLTRWTGVLSVSNDALGAAEVALRYTGGLTGQWAGNMFYFANFPDNRIDEWMADRTNLQRLEAVNNALIQRWGAFKAGIITIDEMKAVLTATESESWKWDLLKDYCPDENTACYPYDNPQGYSVYSTSLGRWPIPTGVTELPISLNLREDGQQLVGRVVSDEALHYAGDPEVLGSLATDAASCPTVSSGSTVCQLESFTFQVSVGGRYIPDDEGPPCSDAPVDDTGASTFQLAQIPWLVPGFTLDGLNRATVVDPATGRRYRRECRDAKLPFGDGNAALNQSFSQANPIPDGRPRVRTVELVDGIIVDQREMIVLFRERFQSFLGADPDSEFAAYGVLRATRSDVELDAADYEGNVTTDARDFSAARLDVGCSEDLVARVRGDDVGTLPADPVALRDFARRIVLGRSDDAASYELDPSGAESVHYYCEDTGLFDGGKEDRTSAQDTGEVACPEGSRVTFFTLQGVTQAAIAAEPCQQAFATRTIAVDTNGDGQNDASEEVIATRGTCQDTLNQWTAAGAHAIRLNPAWRCTDPSRAFCDERRDLRAGKTFYQEPPSGEPPVFVSIETAIDSAFRYKTRFRNRTGQSVGFAPEICAPGSDAIPYCYDPPTIEDLRARIDCAVELYTSEDIRAALDVDTRTLLRSYLRLNFAYAEESDPAAPFPVAKDGFERLYAELLVMLGDESYTRAFASRFDLAGQNNLSFEGTLFEPGGINLSGGAGYEMYSLYQAVQYYQMPLDRFYALSPHIGAALTLPPADTYITQATVTSYFGRLIRASTQKARAWSEIAKRYQSFNQPELARRIVERAYTQAYLESVVLARMMLELEGVVLPEDRPAIARRVEEAQLAYRSALLEMRDVFENITDEFTAFGLPPEFVPFPTVSTTDASSDNDNAFLKQLLLAKNRMELAREKEERALEQNRSFEVDAAAFQSELVSIRNNYENQLADICGTFVGEDGLVYPAIRKYAQRSPGTAVVGDPCGLLDTGEIARALGDIRLVLLDMKSVQSAYDTLFRAIEIERERVEEYCQLTETEADFVYQKGNEISHLKDHIRASQVLHAEQERIVSHIESLAKESPSGCGVFNPGGCIKDAADVGALIAMYVVTDVVLLSLETAVASRERQIEDIENAVARWQIERQCDYARVDSNAKVKEMLLDLVRHDIEALRVQENLRLALAELQQLKNQATRLQAEQQEVQQLAIHVEVARNDPNVRIYRNDAVLTADRTFQMALREAYKATKIFEYYTSQSYARAGDLFLVRLVQYGDLSLERYLLDLENAFLDFEELYGVPAQRVQVISLRDDVFQIERVAMDGSPTLISQRNDEFRTRLLAPENLDERGYYRIEFPTRLAQLSPLTHNHKLEGIDVVLEGSDLGDEIARVYLRQKGTGVVRSIDGEKTFYGFEPRMAVVNAIINGERVFSDGIYRNERLRDRPLVNTAWQLFLNRRDEADNLDMNLRSLTDVKIYLYYTDFTGL